MGTKLKIWAQDHGAKSVFGKAFTLFDLKILVKVNFLLEQNQKSFIGSSCKTFWGFLLNVQQLIPALHAVPAAIQVNSQRGSSFFVSVDEKNLP
ncbi:24010_t:CDS:2 [Gigaspora margarita]|uniref:24010_t:CDS:1 n=1 Tax=Gigaspora margarita TaxID=4874 RepID=A0ABN7UGJ0_GIGMA|nr:24010_t:CDS:2 [Gigaspora margarita]